MPLIRRISKDVLRRFRRWTLYQDSTTILEAHQFLMKAARLTDEYNSVRNITNCATEIREFLLHTCNYEKTRGVKVIGNRPYIVFRNKFPSIYSEKAATNYIDLMNRAYNR